ncbi:MAG TPA: helix-turn-helix domain-containing protein [Nocardiopsis listeri]|uniref:helix-turn-helix domain-containing protein n=1 Tax=Nocardiopsis listeri TaxID=53440 RepID=UPI001D7C0AB3|nr:helix-turn-helix transcriptional regulator [Nocardiopsis listeri]HJE59948.1 helix-turn-helix domain-containing protein [Nocardiopsis listeri]
MVARLGLANFLKEARGKRSSAEAAAVAGFSKATLSRVERGETTISPGDARLLMSHYGVAADMIESLADLAYAAKQPGWWQRYKSALPDWFSLFVGIETAAHRIRTYEPEWIPGILQTPEYSRAIIEKGVQVRDSEELILESVNFRQRRQEKLTGENPADFQAVINEAALHRQVGGAEGHRAQLDYLLTLSQRENFDIRVLPFSSGAHAASYGSFVLLDYSVVGRDYALAYIEYSGGAIYLEAEEEISMHRQMFDSLWQDSAPGTETEELIKIAIQRIGR